MSKFEFGYFRTKKKEKKFRWLLSSRVGGGAWPGH